MHAARLPAAAGWRWILSGFELFRKAPPVLGFFVLAYWLLLGLAGALPFVGQALATLIMPGLSAGVMQACRLTDRGERVPPATLFSGFAGHAPALVSLGGLYLAATLVILATTSLVDGGALLRIMLSGQMPDPAVLEGSDFAAAVHVALILYIPLFLAYWFAPMLAAWHGLSPAKALFFSFVAAWRNWRAFLVYGLAATALAGLLPVLVLAVAGLLFPSLSGVIGIAYLMGFALVLMPIFFASFYASYRDVFAAPPA